MYLTDLYVEGDMFKRKRFIFYPENSIRQIMDVIIALLIFVTCGFTPFFLAFPDKYDYPVFVFDNTMNAFFFVDIIMNFFTAYYDEDFEIVDDLKSIFKSYIFGWLLVDLVSVIPFDQLTSIDGFNRIARISRIGKLYKVIKIAKLMRLLKSVKVRNKISK